MKENTMVTGIDNGTSTAACLSYTKTINIHIINMRCLMIIARIQTVPCTLQALTQISEQANSTYILMKLVSINTINSLFNNKQIALISNKRLAWIRYFRKRG